jgi:hypothetical protein
MKKKSIFLIAILLVIGVFFQYFLIETSPRIPCNEIKEQLLKSVNVLIYQFIFLIFLLSIICKFIFKETNIEIVKKCFIYTFLYLLFFVFLFYKYANKCVDI